jgi:hypothetical protein
MKAMTRTLPVRSGRALHLGSAALMTLTLSLFIGGDGGVKQRPVYPGECLARGSDGKLFVARSGEPCVALQREEPEQRTLPASLLDAPEPRQKRTKTRRPEPLTLRPASLSAGPLLNLPDEAAFDFCGTR